MDRITQLWIHLYEKKELGNDELNELVHSAFARTASIQHWKESDLDDFKGDILNSGKGKKISFLRGASNNPSELYEEAGNIKQAFIEERLRSATERRLRALSDDYFTPKIEGEAVSRSNKTRASNAGSCSAASRQEGKEENVKSLKSWLVRNNYPVEEERNRKGRRPYMGALLEYFKHKKGFSKANVYRLFKKI